MGLGGQKEIKFMCTKQNEEKHGAICARKVTLCEILCDVGTGLCEKICPIIFTTILSAFCMGLLYYIIDVDFACLTSKLADWNLNMLGVDIAILSILVGLFSSKKMDDDAKKAYNAQYSIIFLNAFFQLLGLLLSVFVGSVTNCAYLYITLFVQIWAMIGLVDLLFEVYTLHSLQR